MAQVGLVLDPLDLLNVTKDSSLAIMEVLQKQGHTIITFETRDLYALQGNAYGKGRAIRINLSQQPYYETVEEKVYDLSDLSLILMRKDPPFDMAYVHATHILEAAKTRVSNPPRVLRWFNEKASLPLFPKLIPPTCMSKNISQLKAFLEQHKHVVFKPLNQMGGAGIFVVKLDDLNQNVILETLTQNQTTTIMAQAYLPEIKDGDHRILIFFGVPLDYVLCRVPGKSDPRGNLAAGAKAKVLPLSDIQRKTCTELAPFFLEHGLDLVGLDMIGSKVTEINITSPTGFREISQGSPIDAAETFVTGLKISTG